ncbi:GntR family transcriptional regulator [Acuticoccus sp. M5D2P5]|uniref:GntR family transcriptional regulator n=1 Tax=Acuticoccus kalidii TaxID=2910977 RepID=UPI001F1760F6|nr:GntR family transcriptional regulator [Acuticoccus kalidii]MCF3934606.1 GntR family transcriptional regulator [Acuticoccus kalidii]
MDPTAAPILRRTLHEQVTERVRDMIIEGHLSPGQRISEAQLVEQLGVSRTPLREALRTLAAENLIDSRPSRGSVVRALSPKDIFHMLEVLADLERLAGRLGCERGSDADIAAICAMHEEMMRHYARRDRLPYYKANQAIHSMISALPGNPTLIEMQSGIQARLKRIRFIGNQEPEGWTAAVAEHEAMIDALTARDGERLGNVLADHMMKTWDRVRHVVTTEPSRNA